MWVYFFRLRFSVRGFRFAVFGFQYVVLDHHVGHVYTVHRELKTENRKPRTEN